MVRKVNMSKVNRNLIIAIALLAIAPFVLYPVFLAKVLCFALFALAFNLFNNKFFSLSLNKS